MSNTYAPREDVQQAFLDPTSNLIRWIEVYEADGVTPWRADLWPYMLTEGTVSLDYSRDERRNLDATLNNSDGLLNPQPGGMWYDKVFKMIFGIQLDQVQRQPRVLIVEEFNSVGQAGALRRLLNAAGIKVVHFNPQAVLYSEIEDYDVLISISGDYSRKIALLTEAYGRDKGIITCSPCATAAQVPLVLQGTSGSLSSDPGVRSFIPNPTLSDPIMFGWAGWSVAGPQSYRKVLSTQADVLNVANCTDATNGLSPGILAKKALGGKRWLHIVQSTFTDDAFDPDDTVTNRDNCARFMAAATTWVDNFEPLERWTMQLGEFYADGIADADQWRDRIKITGRDATKRCMLSLLTKATTFQKSQPIYEIVRALASNCGISKLNVPPSNVTLDKDQTYERDTSRWDIMKQIAQANSMDLYFDPYGYLVMEPMSDPLLTPPSLILNTGIGGNLVSRGISTSDTELFNHITVIGESSDSSVPLVFGEASNVDPNSPASIAKIGERTKNISSPLITSEAKARALAQQMLSVSSLEAFDLTFNSIMLPWLEVGDIVELRDDDPYWGPSRYLMHSLGYPSDLGPMTGNAKRIVKL